MLNIPSSWFFLYIADRRLSKELSRLPILWMKPSDRTLEKMHNYMSETLGRFQDYVVPLGDPDQMGNDSRQIPKINIFRFQRLFPNPSWLV